MNHPKNDSPLINNIGNTGKGEAGSSGNTVETSYKK
jgi:hypothetical protein